MICLSTITCKGQAAAVQRLNTEKHVHKYVKKLTHMQHVWLAVTLRATDWPVQTQSMQSALYTCCISANASAAFVLGFCCCGLLWHVHKTHVRMEIIN